MATALTGEVQAALHSSPEPLRLAELTTFLEDFVIQNRDSPELITQADNELEDVLVNDFDPSSPWEIEVYLTVLFHLKDILPTRSISSRYFDAALRPALRDPKLATHVVRYAKDTVLAALGGEDPVPEFNRRIFDLYLLDAYNEGSSDDIMEWAELEEQERDRRSFWKSNLEDILIQSGLRSPKELFTEIFVHFDHPHLRLQLSTLLNRLVSESWFPEIAHELAKHDLTTSLLISLLLDDSSTLCAVELNVVTKLLPLFAIHACQELKGMMAPLLASLAKVLCWKLRSTVPSYENSEEALDETLDDDLESNAGFELRPGLDWKRLKMTFETATSLPPSFRQLFTFLYYLFPCNVLRFLRGPSVYLAEREYSSPYAVSWSDALDEDQIRSRCEVILREHICQPLIIWHDAAFELSRPDAWENYDVARITTEAMLLDMRNTVLANQARPTSDGFATATPGATPAALTMSLPAPRISLDEMAAVSVALKSSLDIEVDSTISSFPSHLFPQPSSTYEEGNSSAPSISEYSAETPKHLTQAVATLQRNVLLLRNELNFELWLSRENAKHIGRLFHDKILSKHVENERQGLYNKLRNYRAQVVRLENEIKDQKARAASAREQSADWTQEQARKLTSFREEKKTWTAEISSLRSEAHEAKSLFAAQSELLAEANKEVFNLQTQIKESKHKIDRLKDYEQRIDQHVKMQRLWDDDFSKFTQRGEDLATLRANVAEMQMQLDTYTKLNQELENAVRPLRRQVQGLEIQLQQARKRAELKRRDSEQDMIFEMTTEKRSLLAQNESLREQNGILVEEVDDLKAMHDLLRAKLDGRMGLTSEQPVSPLVTSIVVP